MTKTTSYNSKALDELQAELTKLRATTGKSQKMMQGKGIKEYRENRKNIARILTAINAKATN